MSDPYSILGVDRNATDEDVKKAYRKLSRQYHPDANINNPKKDEAEAKFKEVQQAYQQIMDEREKGYTSGYGWRIRRFWFLWIWFGRKYGRNFRDE